MHGRQTSYTNRAFNSLQFGVFYGIFERTVDFLRIFYFYVCDPNKSLNGTLAVDSPFQTLAVDFSSNLWTSSERSSNTFLIE